MTLGDFLLRLVLLPVAGEPQARALLGDGPTDLSGRQRGLAYRAEDHRPCPACIETEVDPACPICGGYGQTPK
ncbi:MAG: hypothetical protein ACK4NA_12665 [Alphaproteobacteria bacterium]